jgi:hypothetical protein
MKPPDEVEILSVAVVTEVELMLSESTGVLEARSLSGTVQTSNSPVLVIDPLNPTVKVAVVPAGTIPEKMPTPAAVLACKVAETGRPRRRGDCDGINKCRVRRCQYGDNHAPVVHVSRTNVTCVSMCGAAHIVARANYAALADRRRLVLLLTPLLEDSRQSNFGRDCKGEELRRDCLAVDDTAACLEVREPFLGGERLDPPQIQFL